MKLYSETESELIFFSPSVYMRLIGCVVMTVGANCLGLVVFVPLLSRHFVRRRGMAISIVQSANGFGRAISALVVLVVSIVVIVVGVMTVAPSVADQFNAFADSMPGYVNKVRSLLSMSGIILGVAETTTGFYLSTGYKDVPGLVLLLIVLALKPAGLFGKTAIKKV